MLIVRESSATIILATVRRLECGEHSGAARRYLVGVLRVVSGGIVAVCLKGRCPIRNSVARESRRDIRLSAHGGQNDGRLASVLTAEFPKSHL